jgi:Ca2+-binding EF-hand superfamily protein
MALMIVAHRSTCEEIGILRKVFQKYASNNNNGCISYEEFRDAWKESGLPPEDTKSVFDAVDLDGSGRIRYTEFLAATIEAQGAISEERLADAFDRFDTDDSGYISVDNLAAILGKDFPRDEIQDIIGDAGETDDENPINGGGDHRRTSRISYSAFLALWEKNNEKEVRANKLRMLGSQANLSALAAVDDDDNDTIVSASTLECQETAIARATFLMDKHGTNNNNNNNNTAGGSGGGSSNTNTNTASSFSSSKKNVGFEDTMIAISANNHVEQKIVDDPDDYDIGGGIVI